MDDARKRSVLSVPNDLNYLPAIQDYTRAIATMRGFHREDVDKVLLALEEAIVNIVKHAFEEGENALYEITYDLVTSGIAIILKDKGIPFDPSVVPEYVPPDDVDKIPMGLGSMLMRSCVDEIIFRNLGREGKELHLIKYLPCKNVTEFEGVADAGGFRLPTAPQPEQIVKIPYIVRLMDASEALEVSRLFYRAYGYTYGIDTIYYPERFTDLNKSGEIISAVAVTDSGELMGHVALVMEDMERRTAEAGMAVVKHEYRGQGCMERITAFLIDQAFARELAGLFGKAVATHVFSQKVSHKAGFSDCAVVLGLIPADRSYRHIKEALTQRETVVYSYRAIKDPSDIVLYPPEHHSEFIERIYRALNMKRTFGKQGEVGAREPEGDPLIKTTMIPSYNRAVIELGRYGGNVTSHVRATLRELCLKRMEQITLYLNLEDYNTARYCEEFEGLGFFIAGILPCSHVGDALVLQYLNNVPIDYAHVRIASEDGNRILEYVRSHDPNRM